MGNILCPESPVELDVSKPLLEKNESVPLFTGNRKEISTISEDVSLSESVARIEEIVPSCNTCGNKKHRQRILSTDLYIANMKIYLCLNCKPKSMVS